MKCEGALEFTDCTHECLVKGQGDMPCCMNFLILSPLMIVASAIRLACNLIFGILALLATIVSCCCARKSTYAALKNMTLFAFANAGASLLHIVLAVLNIASLGYFLSSCRSCVEFDLSLPSALKETPAETES